MPGGNRAGCQEGNRNKKVMDLAKYGEIYTTPALAEGNCLGGVISRVLDMSPSPPPHPQSPSPRGRYKLYLPGSLILKTLPLIFFVSLLV